MNNIVCYTCITNNYDSLKEPFIKPSNIDFICFSNTNIISKNWKIVKIPDDLKQLNVIKQQRILKICPHKYLPKQYNVSIWVDGSFVIKNNLNTFIEQYDLNKYSLYARKHRLRDCIYDEANAIIAVKKDNKETINKVIKTYIDEKYPKHNGLVETGILLRKHNDLKCIEFSNFWAIEVLKNSHRDQMSFNYVAWKHNFKYGILDKECTTNNKFFQFYRHKITYKYGV